MNTPNETLASQLELAARIVREGLEWEFELMFSTGWVTGQGQNVLDIIKQNRTIRIKPFTLPDPPPGRRWHRTDGWTKEMLPDGWRPLLDKEKVEVGDSGLWQDGNGEWDVYSRDPKNTAGVDAGDYHHFRTRRPLPLTTVPWSCQEDVPWTGPVWMQCRTGEVAYYLVTGISSTGVAFAGRWWTWKELEFGVNYSLDRRTWHPCTKPAKP